MSSIGTTEAKQSVLLRNVYVIHEFFLKRDRAKGINLPGPFGNQTLQSTPVSLLSDPGNGENLQHNQGQVTLRRSGYNNFSTIVLDKDVETTVSRLTRIEPRHAIRFMAMTPLERSMLVPILELSRLEVKDGKRSLVPIVFTSNFNDEYINFLTTATDKQLIGENNPISGCGIKKITIEDRPENTADVNIKCTIEMVFENVAALLQHNIRRLITTPDRKDSFNGDDYRLRLRVGWHIPTDTSGGAIDQEFKDAISKCSKLYLLELYQHSLNFAKNGKITLTAEYQGGIDGFLSSNKADLFEVSNYVGKGVSSFETVQEEETASAIKDLQVKRDIFYTILDANKETKDPEVAEANKLLTNEVTEIDKQIVTFTAQLKGSIFGSILKRVYNSNIFSLDVPWVQFKFISNPELDVPNQVLNVANKILDLQKKPRIPGTTQNFCTTDQIRQIILKNIPEGFAQPDEEGNTDGKETAEAM